MLKKTGLWGGDFPSPTVTHQYTHYEGAGQQQDPLTDTPDQTMQYIVWIRGMFIYKAVHCYTGKEHKTALGDIIRPWQK